MLILAVDTTSSTGSTALLKGKKLLSEIDIDSPITHSERLLPTIQFILRTNKLKIKDIDAFAVAVGPGSFTGIRIGLSMIKSFSFASGKPVVPISTLEAFAFKLIRDRNRLLCPVLDAKKGEIYAALFKSEGDKLLEIVPQGVYVPDRFLSSLPSHRVITFIGSGVDVYRDRILKYFKDEAKFSKHSLFIASEVGSLGYEQLIKNKGKDFREIKPLYFRKSQAEENH